MHRQRIPAIATALTLLAVLAPMPLLLPDLNERAVLAWHVLVHTDGAPVGLSHAAMLVLGSYVVLLVVRYVAFVAGSLLGGLRDDADADAEGNVPAGERGAGPAGRLPWPLVTIVVPAYNEGPVIRQSIRSLLRLDYPCFEVLVVDDGSSDDTYPRALEASRGHGRVRVIRKANGGKASALNVGLAHARGTLVLNMDADSKLSGNALRACVRHFRDPSVGAVAGNIKVVNRENLATRLQAIEYIHGLGLERRAQDAIKAVSVIGGPLGMFRRDALREVGGYDSDTFAEDRDVTLKLLARGWLVTYEPQAMAWCESPSRWLDLLGQRYRWTRGTVQAVRKHRRWLWSLRTSPVMCLSLWYMTIDSFVVPVMSLAMLGFFGYLALAYGSSEFLLLWWTQAALFDVAVTLYCVEFDGEDRALVPYALALRFYAIFTDVAKLLATAEELFQVEMSWGKLVREGKL
ncbi:MAG: glycosyltransferase family 2 protein [Burkholderiales bacterium]|nr:glycosyltransferase family 2 protein [Burkholderiales bacterium]